MNQKLYDEAISLLTQVDEVLLKNKVRFLSRYNNVQELRLRTVRYLKAFALFEQKKYEESMDLFSSVSAAPQMVISLFPPVIAGECSQHEQSEEPEVKSTEGENGNASIASTTTEGVRASLDSARRSKDGESDENSILSKHTEISGSGPPGILGSEKVLIHRGKGSN